MARWVTSPNHRSTWFSHEAYVGVKCAWYRGRAASHARTYFKTFAVIERAAGRSVQEVTRDGLSSRIGLAGAEWRPVVEADGTPGYRLWMAARDMAPFGLLVAAGGRWGADPVLADTAFVAAMLSPQAPDNPAYGFLWWLNGPATYRLPGPAALPTFAGPLVPGAPPDIVAALGAGDKKIYVSRAMGVVVRHGAAADADALPLGPSGVDEELWRRFRAAMRYGAAPGGRRRPADHTATCPPALRPAERPAVGARRYEGLALEVLPE
jgi:hypothetical protein